MSDPGMIGQEISTLSMRAKQRRWWDVKIKIDVGKKKIH